MAEEKQSVTRRKFGKALAQAGTAAAAAGPALAQIDSILSTAGLSAGAARSVACASPCLPDSQVTATVTVPFTTIIPAIDAALGTVNITETAVMRYE